MSVVERRVGGNLKIHLRESHGGCGKLQRAAGRDSFLREGPAAPADHAFDMPAVGRQIGIDATRKMSGERPTASPAPLVAKSDVVELVQRRWQEYGIAAINMALRS